MVGDHLWNVVGLAGSTACAVACTIGALWLAQRPLPWRRERIAGVAALCFTALWAGVLAALGGVEKTATLRFSEHVIFARAEDDVDRNTAKGKASSVQFLHFSFTKTQIVAFRELNNQVVIGLGHPSYSHMAVLPRATQLALGADFNKL